MLEAGRGSIVNVASIVGATVGMPWRAPYASSKAGVVGLTRTLAVEWAGRGVRVNALLPGPVRTPMVAVAIAQGAVDPQGVVDHTPAGRWALPEDIADAVLLLCSPAGALRDRPGDRRRRRLLGLRRRPRRVAALRGLIVLRIIPPVRTA